jgi:drug/metabolite transporter (DMT)-like permease
MNHHMHSSKTAQFGFVMALISAVSFSTLGIFAKMLYAVGFSVTSALAWRFAIAATFLWIVVCIRRRVQTPCAQLGGGEGRTAHDVTARTRFFRVFLLGLLGFSPQAGLFFLTVKILDPGITSLLLYLYPSFVFLISFLLKRQKPGRVQSFALLLSLAGSVLTFWQAGSYPPVGMALGIVVAISYALYLVAGESILRYVDSLWATAVIMTAAALVYLCFSIGGGTFIVPASLQQVVLLCCIALLATVLPIVTLFLAMQRIGARDTSIISTVEPVCTNIFSAMVFGELMTGRRILGGSLILAGVLVLNIRGYTSQRKVAADS